MYSFLRNIVLRPVMFLWFRFTITGMSNIPTRGGVILAGNHIHFIDSVLIPGVVPRKMAYLVGASYMNSKSAKGRLLGWFLRNVGQLAIDRTGGSASRASLETGLAVLDHGRVVGIYPEGSRSRDGKLHRGRTGVARLVLASGVPVVPMSIQGSDQVLPRGARFPRRARITITFGEPLTFARVDGDYDATQLREVTDEIMRAIATLTPQEYDDTYTTARGA
ncbi:1-acyl-sn-glycerol-3-phosphate acyltransferase [Frondihabitans sp. PAMC 28766]|uniref:lysophospholipid acyltransferase family protein n=1 Tax=Frondihabitans sp. PAMC 28766 TaxID=1795630 RepID=UPI0012FF6E2F|nr:lysophospholipid acyltransferase family protein [Frondihabitans sp. PAMC 28766]